MKHFSNLGTTRIAIYTQMVFVIIIAVGGLPGFEWLAYPATAYFLGWWRGCATRPHLSALLWCLALAAVRICRCSRAFSLLCLLSAVVVVCLFNFWTS